MLTVSQNCQEKFEEVAESPRFNFIGNISIGEHAQGLPLWSLLPHYDAILFAYGASKDRKLGIPGEDKLEGIYSARAFVGWYNGLPEYADLDPDLTQGEEATIIGQGNVALDVARILLQDPNILKSTDITTHAIDALRRSTIRRVRVVGRRGPLQVSIMDYYLTLSNCVLGCIHHQGGSRAGKASTSGIPSHR
jgi:adrenodoxin-NADP+ reductase